MSHVDPNTVHTRINDLRDRRVRRRQLLAAAVRLDSAEPLVEPKNSIGEEGDTTDEEDVETDEDEDQDEDEV